MKFSEQWLREWVNPSINTTTLAEQFTMAGLEVSAITPAAGVFQGVVVGLVLSAEQHPNADRLRVCTVDVGDPEKLTIVCGASNVRANLKVAVAKVGAVLPDNFLIKKAKLRGVESSGMICSAEELSLLEESEGILELAQDAPVGMDLRKYLMLEDVVFELDLTPNRGDCLSVFGIAREVAALNETAIPQLPKVQLSLQSTTPFPVRILAPNDCPHYVGRVVEGVRIDTPTPLWMKQRLQRSGLRSISLVVDVTNYVLLELGQPLHAFDLDKLQNEIVVRRANAGESLTLLDGRTIALDTETLVIADQKRPLALAGIMGGLDSAINNDTKHIFLESAFFNPTTIAGRARRYGLSTDGSHRFERFVSPELQIVAIDRATQLLLEIGGGKAGPLTIVRQEESVPKVRTLSLSSAQVKRVLGLTLTTTEIVTVLQRLNMVCSVEGDHIQVTVPLYRFDIQEASDLIEEVARIYGYDRIVAVDAPVPAALLNTQIDSIATDLERYLVQRSYHEAITYSFTDPMLQTALYPQETALALKNPISPELAVMRTSLWPGLLQAVQYNQRHQQLRVRLFEMGMCFQGAGETLQQKDKLGGVITGTRYKEQWGYQEQPLDFFDVKANVEGLFAVTRQDKQLEFKPTVHSALHPGQAACIVCNEVVVGYVGALHPKLVQELDLIGPVYLFEIALEAFHPVLPHYQGISKFPSVRRDLAVLLSEKVSVWDVLRVAQTAGGPYLKKGWVFDVYQGKNTPPNQKSIALGFIWQHPERTLLEEEVAQALQGILDRLKREFEAVLRE